MHLIGDTRVTRVAMPASIQSLVVDMNTQRRNLVEELLRNMGYNTIGRSAQITELNPMHESVNRHNLVLVLCVDSVTESITHQLKAFLTKCSIPVLLFAENVDQISMTSAIQAGVTAYLSLSIQGNRVSQAIDLAFANYSVVNDLQTKVNDLEQRLENRIMIDKAKGLVMKNRHLDESQAYKFLQEYAMNNGKKIVEIAQMIISTAEVLDK